MPGMDGLKKEKKLKKYKNKKILYEVLTVGGAGFAGSCAFTIPYFTWSYLLTGDPLWSFFAIKDSVLVLPASILIAAFSYRKYKETKKKVEDILSQKESNLEKIAAE